MVDRKEYDREYYLRNADKKKKRERKRYWANREGFLEKRKEYYSNNVNKIKKRDVEYYENNREIILKKKKEYRQQNKDKIKEYRLTIKEGLRNYYNDKYSTDNLYKLSHSTRCLISGSLRKKGFSKKSKTCEILGCTFEEFKTYLESKFKPWMDWNNYGNWNGQPKEMNVSWDIDHIIPLSSAITEEDIINLNHYSNLQPLCSYYNRYEKKDNLILSD